MTMPPKARQVYQQLMHESYREKIAPEVAQEWEKLQESTGNLDPNKKPKGGFRAQVARDVFKELPVEEQRALGACAKSEAQEKRAAYVKFLKDPALTLPADRQKCIDNVPSFVGPILAGLQEYTGMHCLLVMAGPVPKYGGEIRTVHVSYGRNQTASAQHVAQWNKDRFNQQVLGYMKDYCATAFTEQDCAAVALPDAADLSKAKYTIARPDEKDDDSGSDSESSSDSSSSSGSDTDSDIDSGLEDEEEKTQTRKKRKLDTAKGSATATTSKSGAAAASTGPDPAPVWRDEQGRTYMQAREANQARNRQMAAEWRTQLMEDGLLPPPKAQARPHERLKEVPTGPQRKSSRLAGASAADDGVDPMDVDMPMEEDAMDVDAASQDDRPPDADAASLDNGPSQDVNVPQHGEAPSAPLGRPKPRRIPPRQPESAPKSHSAVSTPPEKSAAPAPDLTSTTPAASMVTATAPITTPEGSSTLTATPPDMTPEGSSLPPAPPNAARQICPCPSKAAEWFVDAHAAMTRQDLGCHFDALVAAWMRLEIASKYAQAPTNLPSKGRPKQVGAWIAAARGKRGTADPKVTDPAKYTVEWQGWWDALQPKWRQKDADGRWSTTGEYGKDGSEWGPLYQWGVNGTLSLLASLYFWGCAVHGDADLEVSWEAAVLDVSWMLEGMAVYYEKFNRRF